MRLERINIRDEWLQRFFTRCHNLHGTKCMHIKATSVVTENAIRMYHNRTTKYLKEIGLEHILNNPHRVGNADETYLNFVPRNSGSDQRKAAKKARVDPNAHLTVLFTILPTGRFLNPYVLYGYSDRVPPVIKNTCPEGITYGNAPNGWMVKESFLHYLQTVVVGYLETEEVERPFILFVDGHSSHLSLEAVEFCKEQEIVLITLYPNARLLIQPLNGVFAQFKAIWDAFLMEKFCELTFVMNNRTFAPSLKEFMDAKSQHLERYVKSSFKDCGIYPWNIDGINFNGMLETCRKRKDKAQKGLEDDENVQRFGFTDLAGNDMPLTDHKPSISTDPIVFSLNTDDFSAVDFQEEQIIKLEEMIEYDAIQKSELIIDDNLESDKIMIDDASVSQKPMKTELVVNSDTVESSSLSGSFINSASPIYVNNFTDQDQKQIGLDGVLNLCQSKQLRYDLLNGCPDISKNYGEEPLFILSKIVQWLKTPETAILPLIPPPSKKRLRPEVLISDDNIYSS